MERASVLIVISFIVYILVAVLPAQYVVADAGSTLLFGFLILSAYLAAALLRRLGFPMITGYIAAGMLFGPWMLGLLSHEVLGELKLVDDLALTFIAFAAGGELRLAVLKERKRSIVFTLFFQLSIVLVGVTLSILALKDFFPFTAGRAFAEALAVAVICGVVAVARSPSSAIAIISETKARGPFTEMVLGVTVAADVLAIFLFAIAFSFSEVVISPLKNVDFIFLIGIGSEVGASLILGLVLGRGISLYLEKVRSDLTIFILGMAFIITRFSYGLGALFEAEFDIQFHLEPMLICLTAGFFVQNRSKNGDAFLKVIDRSSLPIYAVFFAISGAALNLEALESMWLWALVLVFLRGVFIYIGAFVGGRLSSDPLRFQKASGLGFLTQAGVSLGLVKIVAEKFGSIGVDLATLLVATIAINQVLGPVALKQALSFVGETRAAITRGRSK
jgi:Kef-type K+ transport system membrane component KefB